MTTALKRFLRAPRVIVGEILVITLLCALGASLPQVGSASEAELARLQNAGPLAAGLVQAFSLDRVFRSGLFCGATLLAAASLCLVTLEQLRRLLASSKTALWPEQFISAPFQFEFERPASAGPDEPRAQLWTENRAGMAGSFLLHAGLLLVMCAGAFRALFGVQAVADLIEGETLPPSAAGWPRSHDHDATDAAPGPSDVVRVRLSGRTRHNKLVHLEESPEEVGRVVTVRVEHAGPYALRGTPVA